MWKKSILLSLALIVCGASCRFTPSERPACTFTALDVGQGDAILIQTRDHQDILIDGGPDDSVVDQLSHALPAGDRDIELMVLTHPHADHVNGLVAVTERFAVRHVLDTGVTYHQLAYERWLQLLHDDQVPISTAQAGQQYVVGAATLDVLWPALDLNGRPILNDNAAEGGGVNDTSIVLKLACGGSAAMLMGDASGEIEQRILDAGIDVRSDLLKVGHHGSRFSSSVAFLEAVQPVWAVISVGVGNGYKHPHPTTLLRLQQHVPHILRTDEAGAITLVTDRRGGWKTRD